MKSQAIVQEDPQYWLQNEVNNWWNIHYRHLNNNAMLNASFENTIDSYTRNLQLCRGDLAWIVWYVRLWRRCATLPFHFCNQKIKLLVLFVRKTVQAILFKLLFFYVREWFVNLLHLIYFDLPIPFDVP